MSDDNMNLEQDAAQLLGNFIGYCRVIDLTVTNPFSVNGGRLSMLLYQQYPLCSLKMEDVDTAIDANDAETMRGMLRAWLQHSMEVLERVLPEVKEEITSHIGVIATENQETGEPEFFCYAWELDATLLRGEKDAENPTE
jgi:hypothetical protein